MSYSKAMKWNKHHPKGTRQTCIMHTNSGFTPALAWLEKRWWPYLEKCQKEGITPVECETYYKNQLR